MDGFDPLFDEDIPAQTPFSLSLPTFEFPPPSTVSGENNSYDIFDQNVGTIALLGSHDSEHSQVSSSVAPGPSASKPTSKRRPKSQRQTSRRSGASQSQKPYVPESVHDLVLGQLAKDPNVVPLLQAIVEYVYKTNLVPAQSRLPETPPAPPGGDGRPIKRRRLQRVPAGAEGWTVPFPFPQGEGPQHYHETWEMKRLIVLLGSLIRNLKNWRGQHGTVSFNTQPQKRTFRKRQSLPATILPSPAPTPQGSDGLLLDESFLAQLQVPNPSEFDMSLEALLSVFNSYESNNKSALNLDLGALNQGAPISDILFSTPAYPEQAAPWETSTPLPNPSIDSMQVDVDSPNVALSRHQMDVTPLDMPRWLGGQERSLAPSSTSRDYLSPNNTVNQYPQPSFSGLGLDIATPQTTQEQEGILSDNELQDLLNMVLSSSTSAASMTASPSITTPIDIVTPQMSVSKQPIDLMASPMQTTLSLTPRTVAAVSKRGKGRTTAALRRDLNKQLQQNAVEGAVSSPGTASLALLPLPLTGGTKKGKKMQASDATIKAREEMLDRAREWRDVIVKELERARTARWEAMMEGLVLREIGVLVRDGIPGATSMETDK